MIELLYMYVADSNIRCYVDRSLLAYQTAVVGLPPGLECASFSPAGVAAMLVDVRKQKVGSGKMLVAV